MVFMRTNMAPSVTARIPVAAHSRGVPVSRAQGTAALRDLTPQLLRDRIARGPAIHYGSGVMPGERRRDRQAVRLLSIILLLLQGGRLTVHELAARFKTARDTIYRDLRTLGDVGIPIEGDESGRLSRP